MNDKTIFLITFCGTWALLGAVFLAVGQGLAVARQKKMRRCSERVWGQVADIVPSRGGEGGVTMTPVVEYVTPQGLMRQCSAFSSGRCRYAIGQQVAVWYDPQDPSLWYLEGEKGPRVLSVVFTAVGAGCLAIALLAWGCVALFW